MAWKKEIEQQMNRKMRVIENAYEPYVIRWSKDPKGDQQLFINIYNIMMEEIENMKKVKSNYIHVAFNHKIHEDRKTMDEIVGYFTGQTPRGIYEFGEKKGQPFFYRTAAQIEEEGAF
jgi:hypothetical protein